MKSGSGTNVPKIEHKEVEIFNEKTSMNERLFIDALVFKKLRRGLLDSGAGVTATSMCPLIHQRRADINTGAIKDKAAIESPLDQIKTFQIFSKNDKEKSSHNICSINPH